MIITETIEIPEETNLMTELKLKTNMIPISDQLIEAKMTFIEVKIIVLNRRTHKIEESIQIIKSKTNNMRSTA